MTKASASASSGVVSEWSSKGVECSPCGDDKMTTQSQAGASASTRSGVVM